MAIPCPSIDPQEIAVRKLARVWIAGPTLLLECLENGFTRQTAAHLAQVGPLLFSPSKLVQSEWGKESADSRDVAMVLVKGEEHRTGLTDDLLPVHKPEESRVETVVTGITHHEKLTLRDGEGRKTAQGWA